MRFYVELLHDGQLLAGTGVTRFTDVGVGAGAPSQAPPEVSLLPPVLDAHIVAGATAGPAKITATSGAATTTLPITLVDRAAVDATRAPTDVFGTACCGPNVQVQASVKGVPVYGASCDWKLTTGLTADAWLGCGILNVYTGEATDHPAGWVYLLSGGPGNVSTTTTVSIAADSALCF